MGLFGIGSWEILLILIVALVIWGPGKLPEIARTLGKTVRALKKASFDLTTAVTREIEENKPTPPPPVENPVTKTEAPPSGTGTANAQPGDDQPGNPEEHKQ